MSREILLQHLSCLGLGNKFCLNTQWVEWVYPHAACQMDSSVIIHSIVNCQLLSSRRRMRRWSAAARCIEIISILILQHFINMDFTNCHISHIHSEGGLCRIHIARENSAHRNDLCIPAYSWLNSNEMCGHVFSVNRRQKRILLIAESHMR